MSPHNAYRLATGREVNNLNGASFEEMNKLSQHRCSEAGIVNGLCILDLGSMNMGSTEMRANFCLMTVMDS
jgi:hypothetical protein